MKTELGRQALFVVCCFCYRLPPTHAPFPPPPSAAPQVYTLCFNRWAGWRQLGCKTGTRNLHPVVLNWTLVKFTDIHWPRQTGQCRQLARARSARKARLGCPGKCKPWSPTPTSTTHSAAHRQAQLHPQTHTKRTTRTSMFACIFKDRNSPRSSHWSLYIALSTSSHEK